MIDVDAVKEMVAYAMKHGINYYDTAWGYHGGNSEIVMGEVLKEYPRDSFYLATKFPGFNLENMQKVEEIFEKQLEKCQTTYFDFYLFHNVTESNIDGYLDEKYGIFEYLMKQKEKGRIRHLGFSTHGSLETMERFLKAYGKDLELLTETRLEVLRAANQLDSDVDMSEVKEQSFEYYQNALKNDTHLAYLIFDEDKNER